MAKQENQKIKLLALLRILEQQTDERHPITVRQLIEELGRFGVNAERKSIYADIEALQLFGVDIVVVRGKSNAYYLGERGFQLAELKLLVDSVQAAKFITNKKSTELIHKLGGLTSRHEAGMLQRQVHVQGRAKTMNEGIYYNVDTLHGAIQENRKITFKYYEWAVSPSSRKLYERRWRRGGKPYEISPWSMLWDDENYYLIGYDAQAGMLKHYRVDKMENIQILQAPRQGRALFEALDMVGYTTRTFGMFGGQEMDVRLRFTNRLIGVVIDRFGKDSMIQLAGDEHFTLTVKAQISPQFISWILGFGAEAQVLSPPEVVENVLQTIRGVAGLYGRQY